MKASELIKALTELIEKHGDLPVFADDEEYGPYEVGLASRFVKPAQKYGWNEEEEIPSMAGILLQDEWATDEAMEAIVQEALKGTTAEPASGHLQLGEDGEIKFIPFT